ncbi:PIN domain-containing protein [Patescibacteria group bacterium]|nr:PIN domain-containing protein [Patescibacteria group bacterium]MBU1256113.1 PIN domain-containing protein [Patescibacteria group bacterium]MBU1457193.1 PIN domain-containing protein [Patescibacteria group bacterium]
MKYVVEDSSFVISLLDKTDKLHTHALQFFKLILSHGHTVRTIIPSTVFYETMFVLLKNGVSYRQAKTKLANLMMIDQVINLAITETMILKLAKHTEKLILNKQNKTRVRSNDLLITSIACNQENSCLITSDIGIKEYSPVFPNIFLFNSPDNLRSFQKFLQP